MNSEKEELNISTLCSKCPFFQVAPLIKRKNARKRCRIEPQRQLRIYKCNDFPQKINLNLLLNKNKKPQNNQQPPPPSPP
ncbi:MAG: hypothetical protein FWD52_06570 [Candidatus Bathyarchaeota archaeon]|nr:hypothetical protein [Candidatus Termiticorpusculum sp.]